LNMKMMTMKKINRLNQKHKYSPHRKYPHLKKKMNTQQTCSILTKVNVLTDASLKTVSRLR
jgi:hypothetical protein